MNKSSVIVFLSLYLLVFTSFVLAENKSVQSDANLIKTENAFKCLAEQVKTDCSGTNKIQEIALTILASPPNVTQACYNKLLNLSKTNCFGDSECNAKDTALAILALDHVNENTTQYVSWLLDNSRTSDGLIWYLQQDSAGPTKCSINYNSQEYSFSVLENKKITGNVGNCLSLTNSNYWFQVSPSCYNNTFTISCDAVGGFIATLSYKQPTSPILYILSDTKSAQASQSIELSIKSKCFGKTGCDYEATAWAALALDRKGKDIAEYLPYLIAEEDNNKKFLPTAFIYMLRDFNDYGSKLAQQQKINHWEADNTAYDKYYDTGLALLALTNRNQPKVDDAKKWLLNTAQNPNGCWNNNNIRDTAMILWAMEGRKTVVTPRSGVSTTITECGDAGFFCLQSSECPSEELLPNYYCSSMKKCCKTENLQKCQDMQGKVCDSNKECVGISKKASDTQNCCIGECEIKSSENECEKTGGTCLSSCSSSQQKTEADCDDLSRVCCTAKAKTQKEEKKSLWWIWLLLIIGILAILAYIFKDKIKMFIYKLKSGLKEGGNKSNPNNGRPFPPYSPQGPMQQGQMGPRPMGPPRQPTNFNNNGFPMGR